MDKQQGKIETQVDVTITNSTSTLDDTGHRYSQIFLTAINVVNHALILAVTGYLIYLSTQTFSLTNQHVTLCTIGYVLLMSESITALAGENVWTKCLSRRSNSHIHWILQVLGATCSIVGVVLEFCSKGGNHFHSTHAIIGISSVATMCAVAFLGVPALFAVRIRKVFRPVIAKFGHNFLGIACFVAGMVTQCYGYQKTWMSRNSSPEMILVCTIFTGAITFISLIGPLRSLFNQLVGIFK